MVTLKNELIKYKLNVKTTLTLQQENYMLKKYNEMYFKETIKLYYEYIEEIVSFLTSLNIPKNEIFYSSLLSDWIYKGYFSSENQLQTTENNNYLLNIFAYMGIDIINGHACCRHYSSFFKDVFNKLGFQADILPTYFLNQVPNKSLFYEATHAVNLINFNNNFYGYDPLNGRLYSINDKMEMLPYTTQNKEDLIMVYAPLSDIIHENASFNNVYNKIKKIYSFSSKPIDINYLNDINKLVWELNCRERKEIIKFSEQSQPTIKQILKTFHK